MISFDLISSLSHSLFAMIFPLEKLKSCVKLLNIYEFLEQVIGVEQVHVIFSRWLEGNVDKWCLGIFNKFNKKLIVSKISRNLFDHSNFHPHIKSHFESKHFVKQLNFKNGRSKYGQTWWASTVTNRYGLMGMLTSTRSPKTSKLWLKIVTKRRFLHGIAHA